MLAFRWMGEELFYILLVPLVYWAVDREKGLRLAIVFLLSIWLNGAVKEWLAMPRPDPSLGIEQLASAEGPGFPSGHAQGSLTLWGWLALEFPRPWFVALAVVLIVGTSLSRVYLGVHYPMDTVGGWALGLLMVAGAAAVWVRGAGGRWSPGLKRALSVLVPLLLWPLYPSALAERALGFLMGLFLAGHVALRAVPYDSRSPLGTQFVRLVVGYAGFAGLAAAVRAYVPPGLPALLGHAVVAVWVVLIAPLLFLQLGLAKPPVSIAERARLRRIPSIAAPSREALAPVLVGTGVVAVAVGAAAAWLPRQPESVAAYALRRTEGRPLIIGHRGAAGLAPENTLPAFSEGVRAGATWLELDVHLTADGHVVVIHDESVERTTNGRGRVASLTLAQIQALDAGFRFTPDGTSYPFRGRGVRVPTLEEVLRAFPQARFVVEMKPDDPAIAEAVVAVLDRTAARQRVLLAGFGDRAVQRARALAPDVPTSTPKGEALRLVALHRLGLGAFTRPPGAVLQLPERYLGLPVVTESMVRMARRWGVPLHVWTVNDEPSMRRFVTMGVDGIITDFPDRLARVLAEQARP